MEEDRAAVVWQRSSFCNAGTCVEVAKTSRMVVVRDGKDPESEILAFNVSEWVAFVAGVRAGDFD
jgi:hypothetical protein